MMLVVAAAMAVYAGAAWLVGTEIAARLRRRAVPPARVRARQVLLVLALGGLRLAAYGFVVEPAWLEVSHVQIPCGKLPTGSRPVRIAHISDLHSERTGRLEKRLVEEVDRFNPDVICFTGDAANTPRGLTIFRQLLADLARIAPYVNSLNCAGKPARPTGSTSLSNSASRIAPNGVARCHGLPPGPGQYLVVSSACVLVRLQRRSQDDEGTPWTVFITAHAPT